MDALIFSDTDKDQISPTLVRFSGKDIDSEGEIISVTMLGEVPVIFLTVEQTIELRDYLNTLLEETQDNG